MTVRSFCNGMLLLALFMLIGFFIREKVKPLQKLFLPSSLIGGLILLLLGPQVAHVVAIPAEFAKMPGVLIDIVMASLIFGVTINREKLHSYLDYTCVPMTAYGMQMCVGTAMGYLFSQIWPGLPLGWGVMGVFSFHGGHGTAAATASAFEKLGVEGNMAMGMVLSTIGLIVAMSVGMVLVNYGIRKGWGTFVKEPTKQPDWFYGGALPQDQQKPTGHTVTTSISINHLAFQLCWLLVSLLIGQKLFALLTSFVPAIKVLPSVLHGIVGGAIMWKIIEVMKWQKYVDMKTIKMLSGFLLEIVVFTAMATLDLKLVTTYAVAITLYSIVITVITLPMVVYAARKFCKEEWFEKAVMCFGAATGNTSTGLALLRAIDPESQSSAGDSHGIYSALMGWKDAFCGLTPLWLVSGFSGIVMTCGVGFAIMVIAAVLGFIFFNTKKSVYA